MSAAVLADGPVLHDQRRLEYWTSAANASAGLSLTGSTNSVSHVFEHARRLQALRAGDNAEIAFVAGVAIRLAIAHTMRLQHRSAANVAAEMAASHGGELGRCCSTIRFRYAPASILASDGK